MGCKLMFHGFVAMVVLITCLVMGSVDAASPPSQDPEVFVRITFNVAWARFCYLAPLFKHRLSDILIEERDGLVFLIPTSRIKIVNLQEECKQKHGNVKTAVVDFYISKHVSPSEVDNEYTEHAFAILFHYWEAKRMVLLGPTFERMVDKVEIRGESAHKFPKKLNEGERIGIGIAVGLVIVFTLAVIYYLMYHKGKSTKTLTMQESGRALSRRDSLISKGTEDLSLDDGIEGPSGATGAGKEPGEQAESGNQDEEEEEEEELNIFVTKC